MNSAQASTEEKESPVVSHSRRCYRFAQFHLDAERHVLSKDGATVALTRKTIELLIILIGHRNRLLDKEQLLKMLWADVAVEESNLSQNIYLLRKALGEQTERPRFIETIPKRGYRFIAEVSACHADTPTTTPQAEQPDTLNEAAIRSELPTATATAARRVSLWRRPVVIILTCGLLFCALAAAWVLSHRRRQPRTLVEIKSVAVLPFKLVGASSQDTPLGLGLTDALITSLGNLNQIKVLPTSTVFKYTDSDFNPLEVGRGLGVDAVMAGTVQKDGARIRVTVQLLAVNSGQFLWAEAFESEGSDLFQLQEVIAGRVAQALNVQLSAPDKARLAARHTNNPEAFEAYLRGVYFWNKRTKEGLTLSIKYFQEATQKDPTYAAAYAGLADALGLSSRFNYSTSKELYEQAEAAALTALALDERLPEAHTALGMIYKGYVMNPDAAEREYKRALELNPNDATAHSRYGLLLLHRGQLAAAYEHIRAAYELDPLSRAFNTNMGAILFYRREFDQSAIYYQRALELEPTDYMVVGSLGEIYESQGHYDESIAKFAAAVAAAKGQPGYYQLLGDLGHAYAKAGRKAEAEHMLQQLIKLHAASETEWPVIKIHVGLGQFNQALDLLEYGSRHGSPWISNIPTVLDLRFGPRYDPLRTDPRFAALAQACFNSTVCK
jgi:DNA-binding winged helix-turn-helix (wHTH) protein/TolB-like protein/Tfp pilus assembly protein PilF